MWQIALTSLIAALLLFALYRNFARAAEKRRQMPGQLFAPLRSVITDARIGHAEAAGVYVLTGTYNGADVAIKAVTDLLMLRKLPSLWLMVTLPDETSAPATLDVMLRPAGQSSFSNFDHLPTTFPTPSNYPEVSVLRSDIAEGQMLVPILAEHQQIFALPRLKEVLITPKGLRIVTLLAEGERARYGVYRQAEFGSISSSAEEVRHQLDLLLALKESLAAWQRNQ